MPQTIELADVVASAFDVALQGVWTALPGVVQSYNAGRQTANIQVGVKNVSVAEGGEDLVEAIAVLNAVPVLHVGGAGFRAVFPPAPGDTALVVFCSRSIARWLLQGGVVDPGTAHHHDLSDGVAIVGLRTRKTALTNAPADHASIGHDAGATIEFRQNEIRVGGDTGAQPSFHGPDLINALQTVLGIIGSQVGGLPGGTAAGTTIATAVTNFVTAANAALTTVAKFV
jgi:hypothetical protein